MAIDALDNACAPYGGPADIETREPIPVIRLRQPLEARGRRAAPVRLGGNAAIAVPMSRSRCHRSGPSARSDT